MRRFVRAEASDQLSRVAINGAFAVYAWWLAMRIEVGLRRGSLEDLCRSLGIELWSGPEPAGPSVDIPWGDLHRTGARTVRMLRLWPFEATCLRRSLLVGAVLRDLRPGLRLGVKRDDGGQVAAHAWLVLGGRSVDAMSEEFSAFAVA